MLLILLPGYYASHRNARDLPRYAAATFTLRHAVGYFALQLFYSFYRGYHVTVVGIGNIIPIRFSRRAADTIRYLLLPPRFSRCAIDADAATGYALRVYVSCLLWRVRAR